MLEAMTHPSRALNLDIKQSFFMPKSDITADSTVSAFFWASSVFFVFKANGRAPGGVGAMPATHKLDSPGSVPRRQTRRGIEPRPYKDKNKDVSGTKVDNTRTSR